MKHNAEILTAYIFSFSYMWPFVCLSGLAAGMAFKNERLVICLTAAASALFLSLIRKSFVPAALCLLAVLNFYIGCGYFLPKSRAAESYEIMQNLEGAYIEGRGRIERVSFGKHTVRIYALFSIQGAEDDEAVPVSAEIPIKQALGIKAEKGDFIECGGVLYSLESVRKYSSRYLFRIRVKEFRLYPYPLNSCSLLEKFRRRLRKGAEKLNFESRGIILGIFLGDSQYLQPEHKELFKNAGISHIFAASGFNVSVLAVCTVSIALFIGADRRKAVFAVIPVCFFYAAAADLTPSVCRAFIMLCAAECGEFLGRPKQRLRMISSAAYFMLLVNPELKDSVSFLLSFAAAAGISLWFEPLAELIKFKPSFISDSLNLTVSVYLMIIPPAASFFSGISSAAFLSCIFAVPAAEALFIAAPFVLSGVLPECLNQICISLCEILSGCILFVCRYACRWFGMLELTEMNTSVIVFYYLALAWGRLMLFLVSENKETKNKSEPVNLQA